MSRGIKAVLSYVPQTKADTVPKANWKVLPRVSDSLNNNVELKDSETIVDSRIKTPGLPISATAEGDVEVEMIKGAYDDLIAAAAGNDWDGDVLTFGGDVVKIFALQKANTDIDQYHLWTGMRVNTFKIDIKESDYIGMSFGFMGAGYDNATTAFATTIADTPVTPKATSLSVGDIKIDGSTLKGVACATAFSFEITNNIEVQRCLGGGLYAQALLEFLAGLSGSLTLAYSQRTQEILNKQITGEPVSLEAVIKFGETDKYVLAIPKAQISGDIPSGGKDKLEASLTYTVVAESRADYPTLTRVTPTP